ncbi:hypothetical protein BC830DRAFT_1174544 [Chytriomyces sp. MP71]|nr:hypothetical protein BC830DRAFT_1174544 [Chytriomyces sp. MP71]
MASVNETGPEPDNPFINNSIGLSAALVSFSLVGGVCFVVFCVVRTFFEHIYSPRRALRKGRPPRLPTSFVGWIGPVWTVGETFLLRTVGLDGVMTQYLRFLKTSSIMFLILSLFGLGVIMPTNYGSNAPKIVSPPPSGLATNESFPWAVRPREPEMELWDEKAFLKLLTIENVPYNSSYLRVHLLFTWLFSFLAYACLIAFYRAHVNLKYRYTSSVLKRTSLSKIEYRSIMLFNLPRDLQQEVDLAAYFNDLEIGRVENVVVCRQWFKLREAIRKRMYYLQALERLFADCVRNSSIKNSPNASTTNTSSQRIPDSSTTLDLESSVDGDHGQDESDATVPLLSASDHRLSLSDVTDPGLREMLSRINNMKPSMRPRHRTGFLGILGELVDSANYYAEKYQQWDCIVQELRLVPENSPCTAVAFVTFESPQSAVIASQIMITKRPYACVAKMAPEPRDIFWPNLSSRTATATLKLFRSIFMNSISFFIFFSSIMLAAFSSVVPSWKELPFLKDLFDELSDTVKDYLSQVVPVVMFTAWTSSLPFLLIVICQLQGLEAESWIEQAVFSKYYTYQVLNLLLYIAGLTLWRQFLGHNPISSAPLDVIGNFMPKASSPIMCYVIIQAFAIAPAQLLHVGPLILTWLQRNSPWSRNSPRDTSDAYFPSLLTSLNYGISYTIPAVIWVIGLTYSCIAPLILPFCSCFFLLSYFIHKYILLYIHVPKYETGGMHVPIVVARLMGGITIFQVTMMGVLAIKYGGSWDTPGQPGEWSNYAQMVIGVAPLLVINFFMYWWFRNGYEKLVTNMPMEVLGKVLREVRVSGAVETAASEFLAGTGGAGPSHRRRHDTTQTPRSKRSRVFGTNSRPSSPLVEHSVNAAETLGTGTQRRTSSNSIVESYRSPPSLKSGHGNLHRRASERIEAIMSIVSENPDAAAPVFDDETSIVLAPTAARRESTISLSMDAHLDGADEEDEDLGSAPSPHLEPPSTQVPGILDAPFASGAIPKGDEQQLLLGEDEARTDGAAATTARVLESAKEDLQNYTYIHPALIGRLPVAWLDLWIQPEALTVARAQQAVTQKNLVKQIIYVQRAGAADISGEAGELQMELPSRQEENISVLASVVEGFMGWANMQMN